MYSNTAFYCLLFFYLYLVLYSFSFTDKINHVMIMQDIVPIHYFNCRSSVILFLNYVYSSCLLFSQILYEVWTVEICKKCTQYNILFQT